MPRLTARGLAGNDEAARSAAIAAMGYRLAAAGPRTRQRVLGRATLPEPPKPAQAAESLQLASFSDPEPLPRFLAPVREPAVEPPVSPSAAPGGIRLVAILCTTAACGFALVLIAQGALREKATHQGVAPAKIAQALPLETTSFAPAFIRPAAEVPQPSAATLSIPPPVTIATRPAQPPRRPETHHPVYQAALIGSPKPHARPHALAARIELPRWLTEDHPTPERGLVMSEPPHNLILPPRLASAKPEAAPSPAPIVMAYSAPTQLPPLRDPGYRPFPLPPGAAW